MRFVAIVVAWQPRLGGRLRGGAEFTRPAGRSCTLLNPFESAATYGEGRVALPLNPSQGLPTPGRSEASTQPVSLRGEHPMVTSLRPMGWGWGVPRLARGLRDGNIRPWQPRLTSRAWRLLEQRHKPEAFTFGEEQRSYSTRTTGRPPAGRSQAHSTSGEELYSTQPV